MNTSKITKATVKAFIKANQNNLFAMSESSFDGMTDCVQPTNNSKFSKINPVNVDLKNEHTFGINELWLVGSSRDYFTFYESDTLVGYEISNCCGSSIIATQI